jgi:alpha-aminoadipic semialdehyde synthase
MIDSLWALGLRLQYMGYDTPFLKIRQARHYASLDAARTDISAVGQEIAEKGMHPALQPFTVAFTGYGNVSNGAQEILGLLPVKEISPEKLLSLKDRSHLPNNLIYKVVFKEDQLVSPIDPNTVFDLQDYYTHPEKYKSNFAPYIPHISMLMNCMYWDARYPRILTKDHLEKMYSNGSAPKLKVVGDISCDVGGAVESTIKATLIEDPIYVYNPFSRSITMGHEGEGLLTMAVDILPSELPRDASNGFSDVLVNFIKPIADADFDVPFEDLDLPRAIKKGLILHKGRLTPEFKYIEQYL